MDKQHESISTHKEGIVMATKKVRYNINQLKHIDSRTKSVQSFNLFWYRTQSKKEDYSTWNTIETRTIQKI